jgi:putative ABC transport system permease protein
MSSPLPFIKGNSHNVFKDPNSIVITENVARKYFGNTNPIGKTLVAAAQFQENLTVTGVIKNIPAKFPFPF